MRITESQLRRTIRKAIKEWSVYGSVHDPLDNEYTDFTHQEQSPSVRGSLRVAAAEKEIEDEVCPACHGKGYVMGRDCRMCAGTGELSEE